MLQFFTLGAKERKSTEPGYESTTSQNLWMKIDPVISFLIETKPVKDWHKAIFTKISLYRFFFDGGHKSRFFICTVTQNMIYQDLLHIQ